MLQIDVKILDGISRAIRSYPARADDIAQSFKNNQITSKLEVVSRIPTGSSVCLLGGWYAIGFMLTSSDPTIRYTSVDIDPECSKIGRSINAHNYTHICADALRYDTAAYDCIVNCSTEHMDYDQLQFSFANIQQGKTCIFQNNSNSFIDGHINCFDTAESFQSYISEQFDIIECTTTPLYSDTSRYTILCQKT